MLELLRVWGTPQDRDDAALLVTELVANVVDHVGGEASLTLELTSSEGWLRIAVRDGSSCVPWSRSSRRHAPAVAGCGWCRRSPTAGGARTTRAASGSGSSCGPAQDS